MQSQVSEPEQAQPAAPISAEPEAARPPAPEETDETWEEKEDKLDTENIEPDQLKPGDLKYKYKEGMSPSEEALLQTPDSGGAVEKLCCRS